MMRCNLLLAMAALSSIAAAGDGAAAQLPGSATPGRPVSTYSIVARDAETGELGVAVQSHWFSVGSVVTWAEAGVGAVATQSFVEVSYGPLGLELMKAGKTAPEALEALLAVDSNRSVRQVAMVDRQGNVAVHTGESCIVEAGHTTGEQFSTQANLMARDTVWEAMAEAYESSEGDLATRLMAALEAGEGEGGDIRGKQSAAILIVPGQSQGAPWRERTVDLRVEDHPEPLLELARLLRIQRAYQHMNRGDELMADQDLEGAVEAYGTAAEMEPENTEIRYWQAITMVGAGRVEEALQIFEKVFEESCDWWTLTPRLPASGILPENEDLVGKILAAGAACDEAAASP